MSTGILAINNSEPCNNLKFIRLLVTHWCFMSPLLVAGPPVTLGEMFGCLYLHSLHWGTEAFHHDH